MHRPGLKEYLDDLVAQFEQPDFIPDDPIVIPHGFADPLDQEIIALYAALLAWGRRSTILSKLAELCERMRYRPYEFVLHFSDHDAERLAGFKHRTFTAEDAVWLTRCLSSLVRQFGSVERSFASFSPPDAVHVGPALEGFGHALLSAVPDVPRRLVKHVARPSTGSACKRLNMYLRWMVRPGPVDLGIWNSLRPDQLLLPLDVHSGRTARALGLLTRPTNDWPAALELAKACRALDPVDPCRYDYAFFGAGVSGVSLDSRFVVTSAADRTSLPSSR